MSKNSEEQAVAQVESTYRLHKRFLEAEEESYSAAEEIREEVFHDALSVEVRSAWTAAGEELEADEFRIVLCTGGPHVEINGELDLHGNPSSWAVQHFDWGEEMTQAPVDINHYDAVNWFVEQFYFGE